jgi:hypothetical protein
MSCYQVSEDTIDLLASASFWSERQIYSKYAPETERLNELVQMYQDGENVLIMHKTQDLATIQAIGEELMNANVKSVMSRYDDKEMLSYTTYKADPIQKWQGIATIEDALGAINCYEYQSSEDEGWATSWAHDYCQALRKNLCSILSGDKWDYERPEQSTKLVRII